MERSLLGVLLLAGAFVATRRRWISLPLALLLAVAWLDAIGWLPAHLGLRGTIPPLAAAALWTEFGWIALSRPTPPDPPPREGAERGFLAGAALGGFACLLGKPAWVVLPAGFLGGLVSAYTGGASVPAALRAVLTMPVWADDARSMVPVVFVGAVLLGAVPR